MVGELASLAAAATWALASVSFARAGRRLRPTALNLAKCVLGAAMLSVALLAEDGDAPRPSGQSLAWLAASAWVGLSLGDTAFFGALNRLGPRRALLFWSLVPPLTAALAWGALGEPVDLQMGAGMALTLGGVAWVVAERSPQTGEAPADHSAATWAAGAGLGLVAAFGQALGNIWTKQGALGLSTVEVSVIRLGFGALFLGVQAAAFRELGDLGRLREPELSKQVGLGTAVGTAGGIYLMVYGLQHTYAAVAATLTSTSPLFVLPLARFVLKERISARAVAGAAAAVLGVGVLSWP
jgi:drug/metabolite transporter (DMT)-like permease